ncbi:SGNH/GDSL hydrolase family protein [Paenibacillus thermotolerans]|uniref:SGNH/GDSL hydrolase family protein n=1 Tax=Paenibacillus thermotolerans TaxID=3027807 RepID=UPI002367DA3F|nr:MULTISPECIES: GDSL-type esterase/lipase family protein [unclassified Paenibacillus]
MRSIALGLMIAVAVLFSVSFASAKEKENGALQTVHYVALGDSIAAGQTPYGTFDLSYADYLKDYFEKFHYHVADYTNFAVTGYTSEQLKDDMLTNDSVRNKIKEASVVTIDIGANDLFRKLLSDPANASEGISSASANLQIILSTIDELNPNARVYVMGYYNPFAYYPEQAQQFLAPFITSLNSEIEMRAEANGDTYVPTDKKVDRHYKKYMPNPDDNHLNAEGYQVIAKEFWKAIRTN